LNLTRRVRIPVTGDDDGKDGDEDGACDNLEDGKGEWIPISDGADNVGGDVDNGESNGIVGSECCDNDEDVGDGCSCKSRYSSSLCCSFCSLVIVFNCCSLSFLLFSFLSFD